MISLDLVLNTLTYRNPFTNPNPISTLTDVDVHDLELVRMETYR